jgi:hypothetical protein
VHAQRQRSRLQVVQHHAVLAAVGGDLPASLQRGERLLRPADVDQEIDRDPGHRRRPLDRGPLVEQREGLVVPPHGGECRHPARARRGPGRRPRPQQAVEPAVHEVVPVQQPVDGAAAVLGPVTVVLRAVGDVDTQRDAPRLPRGARSGARDDRGHVLEASDVQEARPDRPGQAGLERLARHLVAQHAEQPVGGRGPGRPLLTLQ